jgi:hypothetical protein
MKDINGSIQYRGKDYAIVFNLNVMEAIQEEFGSIDAWSGLTDSEEPNIKAMIFGFREMLNEGIEIANEEDGTDVKPLTSKQVGRMISEVGMTEAAKAMNATVVESTDAGASKNE